MNVYRNRIRRAYLRKRTLADMAFYTVLMLICSALCTWVMVVELPRAIDKEISYQEQSVGVSS